MSGITYGKNTATKAVLAACQLYGGYEDIKANLTSLPLDNTVKITHSSKKSPLLSFEILSFPSGSQLNIKTYTCTIDVIRSIAQNIQLILPEIDIHIE
jgi:hypothetical protein